MSKQIQSIEHQLTLLPTTEEVVQVGKYDGVGDDDRITLRRLISLAGEHATDTPEPELKDFAGADPARIEQGLYIPYYDPRYQNAQQLVRLGIEATPRPSLHTMGVVFPSSEFSVVARNARDLARHTESKTREANKDNPDRDEVRQKVGRSVGHTLTGKISSMFNLNSQIKAEMTVMRGLYKDLNNSWQAHYKAKNLEKKRAFADERIHEAAEVSTINLNLGTSSIKGLHRAIKFNLYGGNRTHAQTAFNWQGYIKVVGKYMGARVHKLDLSQAMCEDELAKYRHFLEQTETQAA